MNEVFLIGSGGHARVLGRLLEAQSVSLTGDLLNLEYRFMAMETVADLNGNDSSTKRWIKDKLYSRLPGGLRAGFYFFYRYVLRLGFLESREGVAFHVLQGFWYRYLVDLKVHEVKRHMNLHGVDVKTAIHDVLEIEV